MSEKRSGSESIGTEAAGARVRSRAALGSLPWIAIVALTAAVQFVRAAPIDGAVFGIVAVALLADALGLVPRVGPIARPGRLPVLAGAVAACLLLALTPRHGIVDGIVLAGLGIVVIVASWSGVRAPERSAQQRAEQPAARSAVAIRRTAVLWAAVAVATCLWELTSFVLGRVLPEQKGQHPAISDLLDPALDQFWFRALFVVGWTALGLALLSRGGRR